MRTGFPITPATLLAVLAVGALASCGGEKAHEELSTPERTIETYTQHASILESMLSPTDYLRAITCFTKADQKWFEENFESLQDNPNAPEYTVMREPQKMAFVFGKVIAPAGPKRGDAFTVDVSEEGAEATFKRYGKKVRLVKDGPNWRIRGLFGVNAD